MTSLTAPEALNIYENASTNASVTYAPDLHTVMGAEVSTPDLSAPLREVLAQSSWGNWVLVMIGDSNSTRGPASREYVPFDGAQPAQAAKLVVGTCQIPQGSTSNAIPRRSLGLLLFSFVSFFWQCDIITVKPESRTMFGRVRLASKPLRLFLQLLGADVPLRLGKQLSFYGLSLRLDPTVA